jgi:hypothetical protein
MNDLCSIPGEGRNFSIRHLSTRASVKFCGYDRFFILRQRGRRLNLIIYRHVVSMLRIHGAVPFLFPFVLASRHFF